MPKTRTYFGAKNWNLFRYQKLEPVSVPKTGTYFFALKMENYTHSDAKIAADFATQNWKHICDNSARRYGVV